MTAVGTPPLERSVWIDFHFKCLGMEVTWLWQFVSCELDLKQWWLGLHVWDVWCESNGLSDANGLGAYGGVLDGQASPWPFTHTWESWQWLIRNWSSAEPGSYIFAAQIQDPNIVSIHSRQRQKSEWVPCLIWPCSISNTKRWDTWLLEWMRGRPWMRLLWSVYCLARCCLWCKICTYYIGVVVVVTTQCL